MKIPLIFVICSVVFSLQLILCARCANLFRYVPLSLLGCMEFTMWGSFYLIRPGFYTYRLGVICFYLLVAALLAWTVWYLVQLLQKRQR